MPYVSLYRKYRPQTFDDVVGQEHVTTTLRNAVVAGHLASGYLFCGTRGTAKTTCARILAKALNCIGPDGALTDITADPCGLCEPCQSIAASSFVDVLELDAASHGKVDDVRDLVASIKFPPMQGRYKVYIIDEAHQLSRDAMDAFLKTLEEPPHRTVFVLATTELEKLPITIASRCQVFEFKRGSIAQLAGRLGQIAKQEDVTASPGALALIARAAEGSYRDALSLFEQVLAYKPGGIEAADVTMALGAVDEDVLDNLISLLAKSDAAGIFGSVADLLTAGKDIRQVIRNLSSRLRDMLAIRVGAHSSTEVVETARTKDLASLFTPSALLRALETLAEAERDIRWNTQHRLLLETTLLRITDIGSTASISTLTATDASPAQPRPPVIAAGERSAIDVPVPLPSPDDDDAPRPSLSNEALGVVSGDDTLPVDAHGDLLRVQTIAASEPPRSNGRAEYMASPGAPPELLRLQRSWDEVINRMGGRSQAGVPIVRDAFPVALEKETFLLRFGGRFSIDRLESNPKGKKVIEEIIAKTLNAAPGVYKIRCVLAGDEPLTPSPILGDVKSSTETGETGPAEPESDLIEEVIAVFGGRVLDDVETKG